jgi:hypothetical protein
MIKEYMMQEPLNFVRQAYKDIESQIKLWRYQDPRASMEFQRVMDECIDIDTQKFIIPNTGRILDDKLEAIPDVLKLPFEKIVIEYTSISNNIGVVEQYLSKEESESAPKRIIYAEEREGVINLYSIVEYKRPETGNKWFFMPYYASINSERNITIKEDITKGIKADCVAIGAGVALRTLGPGEWEKLAQLDLNDEVRALLEFLEALSCSNVGFSERVSSLKKPKAKTKKGNLPFDSYRFLTVLVGGKPNSDSSNVTTLGSDRSAPREHLRRGHVRKYSSGLKIWINSMIINAGVEGKILKTYVVNK